MSKDNLGDRMKEYERVEAGRKLIPLLPVCIRLDGRSFSSFTRCLERPYDERFSKVMQKTTKQLVEETNACIGYTQSDEISLILYSDTYDKQVYFNGKIQKIVSSLSAYCSVVFNKELMEEFGNETKDLFPNKIPTFDCRVWNVPNKVEAVNTIVWREIDATKNSVSMATRKYYSPKQMMNKGRAEQLDMLINKGINWNNYPNFFKRGTYFRRQRIERKFTSDEMDKLPVEHEAFNNPNFKVIRSDVVKLDMPPITKVINRVEVIFDGEEPVIEDNNYVDN